VKKITILVGLILLIISSILVFIVSDDTAELSNSGLNKKEVNDENTHSKNTGYHIANDDYLNAIRELDIDLFNDPRIQEIFIEKDPEISQMFINGIDKYIIAWNNYGFTSVLIVFKYEENKISPLYLTSPGRDIVAVKEMDLGISNRFIEVTSYSGTGSHMGQLVQIISISNEKVTEAWNYETISYDNGNKFYASYIVFPLVFENPKIVLNYKDESEKMVDVFYLWSEEENRFLEK